MTEPQWLANWRAQQQPAAQHPRQGCRGEQTPVSALREAVPHASCNGRYNIGEQVHFAAQKLN